MAGPSVGALMPIRYPAGSRRVDRMRQQTVNDRLAIGRDGEAEMTGLAPVLRCEATDLRSRAPKSHGAKHFAGADRKIDALAIEPSRTGDPVEAVERVALQRRDESRRSPRGGVAHPTQERAARSAACAAFEAEFRRSVDKREAMNCVVRHDAQTPGDARAKSGKQRPPCPARVVENASRANPLLPPTHEPPIECLSPTAGEVAIQPLDRVARHHRRIGAAHRSQSVERFRITIHQAARVHADILQEPAGGVARVYGGEAHRP